MDKPYTFAQRLKELIDAEGITKSDLARSCGIDKSNVTRYLNGSYEAKQDVVYKIANRYGVSSAWLLGYDVPMREELGGDRSAGDPPASLSPLEKKYNALDTHGKKVVDVVLDEEYKRCIGKDQTSVPKTRIIPLFRAAAGPGEPVSGAPFEEYEVLAPVPGEFAVKISGDSMEPELHDGDIVMCLKRTPEPGEIGVIMVNGFLLVKQMLTDGSNIFLRSVNRARKDQDVDIWYSGNDTVSCYGTVIHRKIPPVKQ